MNATEKNLLIRVARRLEEQAQRNYDMDIRSGEAMNPTKAMAEARRRRDRELGDAKDLRDLAKRVRPIINEAGPMPTITGSRDWPPGIVSTPEYQEEQQRKNAEARAAMDESAIKDGTLACIFQNGTSGLMNLDPNREQIPTTPSPHVAVGGKNE